MWSTTHVLKHNWGKFPSNFKRECVNRCKQAVKKRDIVIETHSERQSSIKTWSERDRAIVT
jgi:hypothetical protein